jgi:hypothetical protein
MARNYDLGGSGGLLSADSQQRGLTKMMLAGNRSPAPIKPRSAHVAEACLSETSYAGAPSLLLR